MSVARYLSKLNLADAIPEGANGFATALSNHRTRGDLNLKTFSNLSVRSLHQGGDLRAAVNVGSVLSFVDGLSEQDKEDVLHSIQLAQRGASGKYDRHTESRSWYQLYTEILENLGWVGEQMAFTGHDQSEGEFRMDKQALAIVAAIATQGQLAGLTEAIRALESLSEDNGTLKLFDRYACADLSGNFQLGSVQKASNGALSMALGAFYFHAVEERRRFLFFAWGAQNVHFWTAAQKLTFNTGFFAQHRELVKNKLGVQSAAFIGALTLAPI